MAPVKLSNDASSSAKGTIFQLYIALQKCLEMQAGQKVMVERYGDVTVSESSQIEVKKFDESLTDGHVNFWKTIHNWMRDEFNDQLYSALVLCTTQRIGTASSIKAWNSSDLAGRIKILERIHGIGETKDKRKKASDKTNTHTPSGILTFQRFVLDPSRREKLNRVIGRFVIADMTPGFEALFSILKDVHCKHILQAKSEDYLCALLGHVISPSVLESNCWEITYSDFKAIVERLSTQYCKGTTQFPVKYHQTQIKSDQEQSLLEKSKLFIEKIKEIEYHEVVSAAISDYLYASNTVLKDFKDYEIPPSNYEVFSSEVLKDFGPMYRTASRNAQDLIKDSKNFYDGAMIHPVPGFSGFETPHKSFRNGVIHMHCDDPDTNLRWKLEDS